MDSEEKLVFDQIKDAGNLGTFLLRRFKANARARAHDLIVLTSRRAVPLAGIWTKVLTSKTGLPRTTITKVLKTLESRKAVKTVKSVKVRLARVVLSLQSHS